LFSARVNSIVSNRFLNPATPISTNFGRAAMTRMFERAAFDLQKQFIIQLNNIIKFSCAV